MFLLRVIDLLALTGLFVQAFLAWILLAVLASIGDRGVRQDGFRSFQRAFLALALALTIMSVRFFRAHDVEASYVVWDDGNLAPTLCYSGYMALKGIFGLLLAQGCYLLGGQQVPETLRRLRWPLVLVLAAIPFLVPGIDALLTIQAPVIVAASLLSLRGLSTAPQMDSGLRMVRWSLMALAATWILHTVGVLLSLRWDMRYLLSFNSYIDLGVQLTLGIGLVVSMLQSNYLRLLEAEQEQERLRREIEKDEKLRALGTVVSGVAHELNNPLTVILGYADALKRSSPGNRSAQIIAEQAERCRGIVRSLSALAGQSIHPRQDVDLYELMHRVARGLSPELTDQGRRVRVRGLEGQHCEADRIGLEQVITNLVVNGLQASAPDGLVTIEGETTQRRAELRILDEGPGVPQDLRERMFEPFFTTKAPGEGTGLGLSIAHAILRGHGGSITVEDGPEGGTLFRVVVPVRPASGIHSRPVTQPDDETQGRLLIVDDDAAVRLILREQAQRRGWQATEVTSAEEALEVEVQTFDAVLCDLRMPGMGGPGLHDRLAEEAPEVLDRFVFITGDLASPDSVRFSERCAAPLVQKPFDFERLFELLARLTTDARRAESI